MLSRHAGSLCYGLDHITIFRAINQFFSSSLWKAPHHSMSLYTPSTNTCFLGCELYGLHEWATTWFPATKLYTHTWYTHTWPNRGELYELIIAQHLQYTTCMHVCRVWAIFYYSLSTRTCFPGVSCGLQPARRDRSGVCKTTTLTRDQSFALLSI